MIMPSLLPRIISCRIVSGSFGGLLFSLAFLISSLTFLEIMSRSSVGLGAFLIGVIRLNSIDFLSKELVGDFSISE